ncbi:hypothetical protein QUF80_11055 [Desulfococcaceae bacterium HSG8]|nr:hypothetical protein [Desulfococcaceae bacterium HSG8]
MAETNRNPFPSECKACFASNTKTQDSQSKLCTPDIRDYEALVRSGSEICNLRFAI